MTVTYIKGSFRLLGSSPDGDSVHFTPIDPAAFVKARIDAQMSTAGSVQLRLDGIDALETHYEPPGGGPMWRQPTGLGSAASEELLKLLGFDQVDRDEREYVTATIPDTTFGYILTQFADKYGRAVAMVFPGTRDGAGLDGSQVYLDVPELQGSVNYQLLASGLVYPTFYSKLFTDLRAALASVAVASRASLGGVWADDSTFAGFELLSRQQLMDSVVVMPKLFRRFAEYLAADPTGGVDLAGFSSFLTAKADLLYLPPDPTLTTLDTLVRVAGQRVWLTVEPEEIVFFET